LIFMEENHCKNIAKAMQIKYKILIELGPFFNVLITRRLQHKIKVGIDPAKVDDMITNSNPLNSSKPFASVVLFIALLSMAHSGIGQEVISTGVDGADNNIETISTAAGTVEVDTNWSYQGYYDSYNLTRGDVFGSKVSNPNAAITDPITASNATPYGTHYADVITGGDRPGWYKPANGSQWIGVSQNEQNGGTPIDPPGNYVFSLNLAGLVNPNGGEVHLDIGEINADNHFELAISNSAQEKSYLLTPFATQETWDTSGVQDLAFNFSPKDGQTLDVIVANSNDQLSNGKYVPQKNPTGFLISDLAITQDSGPTPAQDKMASTNSLEKAVAPGSGLVMRPSIVAAPEPGSCVTMLGFAGVAAWQLRRRNKSKK